MHTKDKHYMLTRAEVYAMLTKEDQYAQGWGKGKAPNETAKAFPGHVVSRTTGDPFSECELVTFAEKYLAEFKMAEANYCPDRRATRIRLLKAASLLVTALQVHGSVDDLADIAGVSSSKFPIIAGGLSAFKAAGEKQSV